MGTAGSFIFVASDISDVGLSMQLVEKLEPCDIEHIMKLNVAMGRCYRNILDPKESIKAYQTALNVSAPAIRLICFVK
jgi:hypothetical protein